MTEQERPVLDATYILRGPEGHLTEVVVVAVTEETVTVRRVGQGWGRPKFVYPIQLFMESAL